MGTADIDEEGNIWFFTNECSHKASEVSVENTVSLTYSDPNNQTYLSIVAEASLVDDKAKMKELWSPFIQAFFPKGLNDPKLTLLKVQPTDAEYWDSSSSSMVVLFNLLKAVVNGKNMTRANMAILLFKGNLTTVYNTFHKATQIKGGLCS
jgi:general stress protein 26